MRHSNCAAGAEGFRRTESNLRRSLTDRRCLSDIALAFEDAPRGRAARVNAKRLSHGLVVARVEFRRVACDGRFIINRRPGCPGCKVEQELSLGSGGEVCYGAVNRAVVSTGESVLGSARLRHGV